MSMRHLRRLAPGAYRAIDACTVYTMQGSGDGAREIDYGRYQPGEMIEIVETVNGFWAGLEIGHTTPRIEKVDLVQHAGQSYHLGDLAQRMDDAHREEIHSADTSGPQGFWDEFARRYPDEAGHLALITPPVQS